MSSQCQLPCSAAQTGPCPSPCARGDPEPCPAPSCPEQSFQVDPCPCQGGDVCPQVGPGCPCPTAPPADSPGGSCVESCPVKLPGPAMEPCTIDTPGMCVMTFPLQHNILTVELCPSDGTGMSLPPDELCTAETLGSCLEDVCLGEPCTLEVLEPRCAQEVAIGEPCPAQPSGFTEPGVSPSITEPSAPGACTARGVPGVGDIKDTAKDSKSRSSFRLNSRTSSIVERCLSRCQNWFRGKNGEK